VPAANLPWPYPEVIGDELVANGTFDTDISGWANYDAARGTLSHDVDRIRITNDGTGNALMSQSLTVEVGKVYRLSCYATDAGNVTARISAGNVDGSSNPYGFQLLSGGAGELTLTFVATATTIYINGLASGAAGTASDYATFDNVSVREINPLSVSIQMDGRMTYADTDAVTTSVIWRWEEDQNNRLLVFLNTNSTATGEIRFNQRYSGLNYVVAGKNYLPDILVPYNFASRHGSTFLNGAADGVSFTEDTTPTALPDLSATDLDLATAYMGTIGTFRVWNQDLGDDGIVTATAPSLEPSLSLTFDGSGLSFTVLDWSE
jgi:hypothetical protein